MTTIFLDQILRPIDEMLGTQRLSLLIYLIIIFGSIFIFTLALSNISSLSKNKRIELPSNLTFIIIMINIILLLLGIGTSVGAFHYSLFTILSIFMIPVTFYALAITNINEKSSVIRRIKLLSLILAMLIIFLFGSRHIVNGVEEGETTSDMINILLMATLGGLFTAHTTILHLSMLY